MARWSGDSEDYAELVLQLVEAIPPGRATTYGEIAATLRERIGVGGPRQVGAVMAQYGAGVPWWRVVRADGRVHVDREDAARQHHLAEATPMHDAHRVDLVLAGWDPRTRRSRNPR